MAQLDTKGWKLFHVGDLFRLERGKLSKVAGLDEGDIPYVGCSNVNNGVMGFYDADDTLITHGPCICFIGAGNGSAGYQMYKEGSFLCSTGNVCGFSDELTDKIAHFIVSVMDAQQNITHEWSFANGRTLEKLRNQQVLLPATPDGQPDWAYMDAYMGEVLKKEEVFAEHLASLTAEAVVDGHPLDTSSWKVFRIGELFEIRPTKAYKLTNSDLLNVNGNIPVVANSAQNNGVVGFSNLEATEKGGIITFSDTTDANAIFYQSHDFIGYAHVQGMYRKFEKVSDVVMLFLATAFQSQALKMNFDYANKFRRDIALNIEISLPVTADGMPDWTWMEQYMQRQMDKAAALVEHLDAVWN